ncbi:hypothetical protein VPZ60_004334 [Salmonella enterica]|nr:hypothetical protein [Salmonella enterica]
MTSPIVQAMLLTAARMDAVGLPPSPDTPKEQMPEGGMMFRYGSGLYFAQDGRFHVWCHTTSKHAKGVGYWRPVTEATSKNRLPAILRAYEQEVARGTENA